MAFLFSFFGFGGGDTETTDNKELKNKVEKYKSIYKINQHLHILYLVMFKILVLCRQLEKENDDLYTELNRATNGMMKAESK